MEIGARSAPRKISRGILPKFAKSLSKSSQNRENPHKVSRKRAPQDIFRKNYIWFSKKGCAAGDFFTKTDSGFQKNLRRRRISHKNGL